MSDLTNKILDAIDIMADDKVSSVKFDKTVRATIVESVDQSVGKYKVKYQNSTFFAFANDLKSYSKGSAVYVVIPSANFESHPYIVGSVRKLGSDYMDVLTPEDMLSPIGGNILSSSETISFCSYRSFDPYTNSRVLYNKEWAKNIIEIDTLGLELYKENSDTMLIGASFQTKLDAKQQISGGNYGIRMTCSYYDDKYKDLASKKQSPLITRTYELDINKMTGQPYNLFNPTPQRTFFEIDTKNFVSIDSIVAFCKTFPEREPNSAPWSTAIDGELKNDDTEFYRTSDGQLVRSPGTKLYYEKNRKEWYQFNGTKWISQSDIFMSNFRLEFYETLTEEELQSISLRVTYPLGSYFLTTDDDDVVKRLRADLRVKGRRVNYNEQKVHFYWFEKDIKVVNGDKGYHRYGGNGWRCLNTPYQLINDENSGVGYEPDTFEKIITHEECKGLKNRFKCVAVYQTDSETIQVSAEGELTNQTKQDSGLELISTMGESFSFNVGKTTLKCLINGTQQTSDNFKYYWGFGADGEDVVLINDDDKITDKSNQIDVNINQVMHFATYECSVYYLDELLGTATITLTNGEPTGQYRLVLKDGSKVYKYDENGIAPNSQALDEYDRVVIPALSFDIYNDQGQLVGMEDKEKPRMCEITWVWPHDTSDNPKTATGKMIKGISDTPIVERNIIIDPNNDSTNNRWVTLNQATLPYNIQSMYDIDLASDDNNIELIVVFKNQILRAKTNFTFTKDGEQGTNGSPYITRIVPSNTNFDKIVIHNGAVKGYVGSTGTYTNIGTANACLSVEIWKDGAEKVNIPSLADANTITWTTRQADRNLTSNLTIAKINGTINSRISSVSTLSTARNTTVKVKVTTNMLSQNQNTYFDSYPVDVILSASNYAILGGYRECSYKNDGTRSGFAKKPFKLYLGTKEVENAQTRVKWRASWTGNTQYNYDAIIEPPAQYDAQNIDTFVSCYLNGTLIGYVPIDLHLDRYGLSVMNDWDGESLKLNTNGSNYILAPQIGAGERKNGTFTGITMGKAFEGSNKKIGLFGYHQGARSIFLDSETGNAEFGKSGAGRIILGPEKRGIAPLGAIYSGNYYKNNSTTGYPESLNNAGVLIDLAGARIHFGSGNFEVNSSGHLTAKGGGSIAGWKITNNRLTSQNDAIYLDSTATGANDVIHTPGFQARANGSFKAGSKFAVDANGNLTATGGSIAGWNFNENEIYKGTGANTTMYIHKNGSIGGGTGGSYSNEGHSSLKWVITNQGIGYFSDVFINNNSRGKDKENIISIVNKSGESGGGTFTVNNKGEMTSSKADINGKITSKEGEIGGWTISAGSISSGDFKLESNGTIQLGKGFKVNATEVTKSNGTHTGSTGSGNFGGNLDSNSGSSILGDGIGSGGKGWENELLVANLKTGPKECLSGITSASVTINGTTYPVTVKTSSVTVYGVSSWDNYNTAWLGTKIKASSA